MQPRSFLSRGLWLTRTFAQPPSQINPNLERRRRARARANRGPPCALQRGTFSVSVSPRPKWPNRPGFAPFSGHNQTNPFYRSKTRDRAPAPFHVEQRRSVEFQYGLSGSAHPHSPRKGITDTAQCAVTKLDQALKRSADGITLSEAAISSDRAASCIGLQKKTCTATKVRILLGHGTRVARRSSLPRPTWSKEIVQCKWGRPMKSIRN